jgi:hypothetical protein
MPVRIGAPSSLPSQLGEPAARRVSIYWAADDWAADDLEIAEVLVDGYAMIGSGSIRVMLLLQDLGRLADRSPRRTPQPSRLVQNMLVAGLTRRGHA